FQKYQNGCLKELEPEVSKCIPKAHVAELMVRLNNLTRDLDQMSLEYERIVKRELEKNTCESGKQKLNCFFDVMVGQCPPDPIKLVMNFFTEMIQSSTCHYEYSSRLEAYQVKKEAEERLANAKAVSYQVEPTTDPRAQFIKRDQRVNQSTRTKSQKIIHLISTFGLFIALFL
ncbi:hypothetical protein Ciccas_008292, partial [Cichlidogyrus casuarinus]